MNLVKPAPIHESIHSTPLGRSIRDAIRALVPTIRENAGAGEKLGCLPEETLNALHEAGAFRISIPTQFGGHALGARDLAEIIAAIASGDGSAGWIAMIASGFTRVALTFGDDAIEEIYGRNIGWRGPIVASASLFSEKIQRARPAPGGYIVEAGCKWGFGSGCKHAAFVVVGVEVEREPGSRERGMVLLEKGQYEILDDWDVMGLCGSSSNSITAPADIFVPAHRYATLGDLPQRLDQLRDRFGGPGYSLDGRGLMLIVGMETMAITLGMARGAFDCFIEQCRARKPFNLPYDKVCDMPSIQVVAGKVHAMLNAAEAQIFSRADHIDRKAAHGEGFSAAEDAEIMMDFVNAGNLCGAAIDMLQIALGSSTISLKNPIQRYARDTRVALTHGSTRLDPSAEISGRHLLGLPPFSDFAAAVPGVDKAKESAVKESVR